MIGKTIHELTVGDTAQFAKTIAESDIYIKSLHDFMVSKII